MLSSVAPTPPPAEAGYPERRKTQREIKDVRHAGCETKSGQ